MAIISTIAIEAFPGVMFGQVTKYKNITIHYNSDAESVDVDALLDAEDLLLKSEVYDKERDYDVYILNNRLLYLLLGPDFSSGSFVRTNLFNNIIVRQCDMGANLCHSNSPEYNERLLSSLVAHEVTHVNIRDAIGYVGDFILSSWKKEGLADFVAAVWVGLIFMLLSCS